MQGEYRGDFTRDTFDPTNHFSRVLMQQGRVQVDADWNEQTSILLHYLRTLAIDLVGPHWGPKLIAGQTNAGFQIDKRQQNGADVTNDFLIRPGRYYVDGILCENDTETGYKDQVEFPLDDEDQMKTGGAYLVYLDAWERHITSVDDPSIREVALGGPDTATRAKVVWQVKVIPPSLFNAKWTNDIVTKPEADRPRLVEEFLRTSVRAQPTPMTTGRLRAMARQRERPLEPCSISPNSRYRGMENHLYRVEIHTSGKAWDGRTDSNGKPAGNIAEATTFKWSSDNSSITFPIISLDDGRAVVASLGRDRASTLQVNDWVEITDDTLIFRGTPGELRQVESVDTLEMTVTLKDAEDLPGYDDDDKDKHPILRRWDFRSDDEENRALPVVEATEESSEWIALEDGIRIQFPAAVGNEPPRTYRAGDYWLIPARTATGDVEWPKEKDRFDKEVPKAIPAHGIDHHYAPLAVITALDNGNVVVALDCRRLIP